MALVESLVAFRGYFLLLLSLWFPKGLAVVESLVVLRRPLVRGFTVYVCKYGGVANGNYIFTSISECVCVCVCVFLSIPVYQEER